MAGHHIRRAKTALQTTGFRPGVTCTAGCIRPNRFHRTGAFVGNDPNSPQLRPDYDVGIGAGGTLYSDGTTGACVINGSGKTNNGSLQVTGVNSSVFIGSGGHSGIALGMVITGPGINTGTTVAGYSLSVGANSGTITLSLAAGAGAGTGPIALSGDNGGTQFVDANGDCFHRITSTYSPKEWGAYEGLNPTQGTGYDDTMALQKWRGGRVTARNPAIAASSSRFRRVRARRRPRRRRARSAGRLRHLCSRANCRCGDRI